MLHGRLSRGIGKGAGRIWPKEPVSHGTGESSRTGFAGYWGPEGPDAGWEEGQGMTTILLIRHGAAEDPRPGLPDGDRALTEEGWRKTRAALRGLVRSGFVPDLGASSPARRAVETMACLQEAVLKDTKRSLPFTVWEGLLPEGDAVEAEAWLRERVQDLGGKGTLAVTSHQPFLGELVFWLTGENLEVRKASCTVVDWKNGHWRFRRHYRPSELREKA